MTGPRACLCEGLAWACVHPCGQGLRSLCVCHVCGRHLCGSVRAFSEACVCAPVCLCVYVIRSGSRRRGQRGPRLAVACPGVGGGVGSGGLWASWVGVWPGPGTNLFPHQIHMPFTLPHRPLGEGLEQCVCAMTCKLFTSVCNHAADSLYTCL